VSLPIAGKAAHELADDGEERQCWERQWPPVQLEARSYIDIVYRGLLQSFVLVGRLGNIVRIEVG
jgi:hypothetical protein